MRSRHPRAGRVLLIEPNAAQAALYADLLRINCPGVQVASVCAADALPEAAVEAGPCVIIVSCTHPDGSLESLREALLARPDAVVLALIPAHAPGIADEALASGAADVLLMAPGYLEQLPVSVRKNVHAAISREREATRALKRSSDLAATQAALASLKREAFRTPEAAPPARVVVPPRRAVLRLVAS